MKKSLLRKYTKTTLVPFFSSPTFTLWRKSNKQTKKNNSVNCAFLNDKVSYKCISSALTKSSFDQQPAGHSLTAGVTPKYTFAQLFHFCILLSSHCAFYHPATCYSPNLEIHLCINNKEVQLSPYSAKCLRVLDCSALYDWAIQKTSPSAGMQVSR